MRAGSATITYIIGTLIRISSTRRIDGFITRSTSTRAIAGQTELALSGSTRVRAAGANAPCAFIRRRTGIAIVTTAAFITILDIRWSGTGYQHWTLGVCQDDPIPSAALDLARPVL
jgi:hypothetical protein